MKTHSIHCTSFVPGMVILGVETALGIALFGKKYTIDMVSMSVDCIAEDGSGTSFGPDSSAFYVVDTLTPAHRDYDVEYSEEAGTTDVITIYARSKGEAKAICREKYRPGAWIGGVKESDLQVAH